MHHEATPSPGVKEASADKKRGYRNKGVRLFIFSWHRQNAAGAYFSTFSVLSLVGSEYVSYEYHTLAERALLDCIEFLE